METESLSATRVINGLLLEGVDYAGKTSVADALAEVLTTRGTPVLRNQCYLARSPIIQFLEMQAKKLESPTERDWYYTAALLADLYLYDPAKHDQAFIIQDRHWLTAVGRNKFFSQEDLVPDGAIEARHIPFRYNVYLTSSAETKRLRVNGRIAKSPRDRYLAQNPQIHQSYDEFLLDLLPSEENWLIVDTTSMTIDEIVKSIRDFIHL